MGVFTNSLPQVLMKNSNMIIVSNNSAYRVVKPKNWGLLFMQKRSRGILYDSERDTLLVCDASNNRILAVNPNTGTPAFYTFLFYL